jgi:hypothetical protein
LKKKSNALFALKTLKNELEKETWKIVKIFRSDNGREYISNKFLKYYKDSGIRR